MPKMKLSHVYIPFLFLQPVFHNHITIIEVRNCTFITAMAAHAGTSQLLALAVVFLSLLTTPPLLEAVQCPRDSVSVNNGSLMFRPLSPGTDNTNPSYNPGAIGGWYSLASGFVDVVRSGSLPYSK